MKFITFIITMACCLFLNTGSSAQAPGSPQDELAIRDLALSLEKGWNDKDGQHFARNFADDHDFIVWQGMYLPKLTRIANAEAHQRLFDGKYHSLDIEIKLDQIRFINSETALVYLLAGGYPSGTRPPEYPEFIISLLVKQDQNAWKIVSFHNSNIEYDKILETEHPDSIAIKAYAQARMPLWYQ